MISQRSQSPRTHVRTLRWKEFFKLRGSRENETPPVCALFTRVELPCCLTTSQIRSEERVAIAAIVYVELSRSASMSNWCGRNSKLVYAPASGKVQSVPEERGVRAHGLTVMLTRRRGPQPRMGLGALLVRVHPQFRAVLRKRQSNTYGVVVAALRLHYSPSLCVLSPLLRLHSTLVPTSDQTELSLQDLTRRLDHGLPSLLSHLLRARYCHRCVYRILECSYLTAISRVLHPAPLAAPPTHPRTPLHAPAHIVPR